MHGLYSGDWTKYNKQRIKTNPHSKKFRKQFYTFWSCEQEQVWYEIIIVIVRRGVGVDAGDCPQLFYVNLFVHQVTYQVARHLYIQYKNGGNLLASGWKLYILYAKCHKKPKLTTAIGITHVHGQWLIYIVVRCAHAQLWLNISIGAVKIMKSLRTFREVCPCGGLFTCAYKH